MTKFETHGRDEGARPYPAMRTLARVLDEESFLAGDPAPVLWGWGMLDDEGCTGDFGADFVTTYRPQYMLWSENPAEQDPAKRNYTLGYACNGMPSLGSCEQPLEELEEITRDGGGTTYVTRTFDDPGTIPDEAAHYAYWAATFRRVPPRAA